MSQRAASEERLNNLMALREALLRRGVRLCIGMAEIISIFESLISGLFCQM